MKDFFALWQKSLKIVKVVNKSRCGLKGCAIMRKAGININVVKSQILSLKGREVEMDINRGRKKIDRVNGTIQDVYPSVFTVRVKQANNQLQTFSYYDVLCGNVVFCKDNEI